MYVDSNDENTGYRVAEFLSDKNVKCKIIVHSWNSQGAKNILRVLPQADYRPFNPLSKYSLEE